MSVIREFSDAIAIQQQTDDEAYDEQMLLPLDERIAKGVTMSNLTLEFAFYEGRPNKWCASLGEPVKYIRSAKIICDNNISKFREGGQVVLSHSAGHSFKMDIIEDSIGNFILAPNDFEVKICSINSEDYTPVNWEINVVKTSLTHRLLSATTSNLLQDVERLRKIESLLGASLGNSSLSSFTYSGLNSSQNVAVEKAIDMPNFHLIQGPPGTGKTKTIAHIAKLLVNQGLKVFVSAPTHTAINNCLSAISEEVQDKTKVVKIGEKYQASEILHNQNMTRFQRLPWDKYIGNSYVSQEGIIIGGTPYCLCYPASKRLNNWEFDVALIDEAAQMSIPHAISVMSKSNKFIFVGDHQQLDPIMPSGTGLSMFSESIFSRLVKLYPQDKSLLNTSYRLNEELIRIPNELFYNNELNSADSTRFSRQHIGSASYSEVLNHPDSKVLYLHKVFDAKGRSPHEAAIVAEMVSDLVSDGVNLRDIGILTPYLAQVREIKKALNTKIGGIDTDVTAALFIDTVDRMQGQERDYIIYSMSNSHPLESKRRLDFFYSPNRLNVAITRGIKKCIVIANYKVFDIIDDELVDLAEYAKLKPSLDIFKKYYQLSTKIEELISEDEW